MAKKNQILSQMSSDTSTYVGFTFDHVAGIVEAWQAEFSRPVYMMTFGCTSQPIPSVAVKAMTDYAQRLGHAETYSGYEPVIGIPELKQAIAAHYREKLGVNLSEGEVFVTDGAQMVLSEIQELFSRDSLVAMPNPTYPAYIEGTLSGGRRHLWMPCYEENRFVPELPSEKADLIYLCFPNNPTGAVATYNDLQPFVDYARDHGAVIIFDAAYRFFVNTRDVPRSIYEIEGAETCAIEIGSFSKEANFAGLRVGWCVVPRNLTIEDAGGGELHDLWTMQHEIRFWGPSNIAQHGAIAVLTEQGQKECQATIDYYLKNAKMLGQAMEKLGITCFGGTDSPYLWLKAPKDMDDWQFFKHLMHRTGIAGLPGSMFGSAGKGYLRLSALGKREGIEAALSGLPDSIF
jgi:LL-diaminopimelate aminotransferase